MTTFRNLVFALAIASTGALGCAQSETASTPTSMQQVADDSMHDMHEPPGPELLFVAALKHLDLTAEQRTAIDNARQGLGHDDRAGVMAAVAAGVRAGAIDEQKLLATIDAAATPARQAALATALATLHATLTPEQRRALVDAIGKHAGGHAMSSALPDHLVAMLGLTDDQLAQVQRIVAAHTPAPPDAMPPELAARLQSFAADPFDAAAFVAPTGAMRDHVRHMLDVLAAILPVLDASQREALATMIESRAAHAH
jgi:hypothetical protein